jgi:hypothetical protein
MTCFGRGITSAFSMIAAWRQRQKVVSATAMAIMLVANA